MVGVEPSTVENFLHFIYTGESKRTLANEELLKLADDYGLTTLTALCHDAVTETEATQMTKLMECLNNGAGVLYPSKIMY
jgi:ATP-dependent RNA circularization protein (DNA/RNA ligase family)